MKPVIRTDQFRIQQLLKGKFKMLKEFLARFEWYRKHKGGKWHYNRYRYGNICAFAWEREYLGKDGGERTTVHTVHYYKPGDVWSAEDCKKLHERIRASLPPYSLYSLRRDHPCGKCPDIETLREDPFLGVDEDWFDQAEKFAEIDEAFRERWEEWIRKVEAGELATMDLMAYPAFPDAQLDYLERLEK